MGPSAHQISLQENYIQKKRKMIKEMGDVIRRFLKLYQPSTSKLLAM
jgi:hypothetical protein